MFQADCHVHSTASDGSATPEELIDLALAKGLSALSITDHDTLRAYTQKIRTYAQEKGLDLLPGIELSCKQRDRSVHILGLGVNPESMALLHLCEQHEKRRELRNGMIIDNLRKMGKGFDAGSMNLAHIGRVHIASKLVEKGHVANLKEAFTLYIGDGKPCYEECTAFDVEMSIDVIKQAGGRAFIAHPHLIRNHKILRDLLEMEFDGIECYYGNFDEKSNRRWLKIAEQKQWLISGGSDYHGIYKETIDLGASWIGKEDYDKLSE